MISVFCTIQFRVPGLGEAKSQWSILVFAESALQIALIPLLLRLCAGVVAIVVASEVALVVSAWDFDGFVLVLIAMGRRDTGAQTAEEASLCWSGNGMVSQRPFATTDALVGAPCRQLAVEAVLAKLVAELDGDHDEVVIASCCWVSFEDDCCAVLTANAAGTNTGLDDAGCTRRYC